MRQPHVDGYIGSENEKIIDAVNIIRKNDKETYIKPIQVADVNNRTVNDIKNVLGTDVTGYKIKVQRGNLEHIERRHGTNGEADRSMASAADIARMGFVLENYDYVRPITNADGSQQYSGNFKNSDGSPAPLLLFSKRVNGTYYVAEAVPDAKAKTLWVVSVYKNAGAYQEADVQNKTAPRSRTSENELEFTPAQNNDRPAQTGLQLPSSVNQYGSIDSIADPAASVNTNILEFPQIYPQSAVYPAPL